MTSFVVTIDGPAGAGKSTVARQLATRLGYSFLDTGAIYRTVALVARQRGIDWADGEALGRAGQRPRPALRERRRAPTG